MKNRQYRNCQEERRVELLKEQYEFDEATKTFDIVLHFPRASDIFDERLDLLKKRVMKDEVLEMVASLLSDVPRGYKADISLVIDDYEEVPAGEILDAFHNVLKVRLNRFQDAKRKKYHKVGALVLIGVFLIALMILGEVMRWWGGDSIQGRLLSYVIDTAGCVLIWEGLYSALLERSHDAALGHTLSTRLSSIGLYRNDDSEQALLSENSTELVVIEKEKLGAKAGSSCLYLSGFFLLGAGLTGVMLRAPLLAGLVTTDGSFALVFLLMELVSLVLFCGLGFLAITMFNENYRYFIFTTVVTALLTAVVVVSVVNLFLGQNTPVNIIAAVASTVAMIVYILGFSLSTYHHWPDIKKALRGKK